MLREELNAAKPTRRPAAAAGLASSPAGAGAAAAEGLAGAGLSRNESDSIHSPLKMARITPPRFGPVNMTSDPRMRRERAGMLLRALTALGRESQTQTESCPCNNILGECPNAARGSSNAQMKKEAAVAVLRAMAALRRESEAAKGTPVFPSDPFNNPTPVPASTPSSSPSSQYNETMTASETVSSDTKMKDRGQSTRSSTTQTRAKRWKMRMRVYCRGRDREDPKTGPEVPKLAMRDASIPPHMIVEDFQVILGPKVAKPVTQSPPVRVRESTHKITRAMDNQESVWEVGPGTSQMLIAAGVLTLTLIIMVIVVGGGVNFSLNKEEHVVANTYKVPSTEWKTLKADARDRNDPSTIGYKLRKAFKSLTLNILSLRREKWSPSKEAEDLKQENKAVTKCQPQDKSNKDMYEEQNVQNKDTNKNKHSRRSIPDPYPYTYIVNILKNSRTSTLQFDHNCTL